MAKYTSDTNLIRGAATAYKNWSNVPGMYEGLDEVVDTGKKVMDDAIKDRNDALDRMNKVAEEALLRGGGLGKNHYDYSLDLVNSFKENYWKGATTRGPEGEKLKMDSLMSLNNHITEVADLKALNADYAKLHIDKDLTSAMNNETYETSDGVYTSRRNVLEKMLKNDYTPSQNEEGQTVYTMDIDGTKHSITKDQYVGLVGLKDYKFGNAFDKQIQRGYQSPITNIESFRSNILKSLPDDAFGLEGVIEDGLRGEHLEGLIRNYITPNNLTGYVTGFDTDEPGLSDNYISDDEYENFIDAILNFSGPNKNKFSDVGNTKKIIAEVATLHGKYLNDLHWAEKLRSRQQQGGGGGAGTPETKFTINRNVINPAFESGKSRDKYVQQVDITTAQDKLDKLYSNQPFTDWSGNTYEPESRNGKFVGWKIYSQDASQNKIKVKDEKPYLELLVGDKATPDAIRTTYLGLENFDYTQKKYILD